MIDVNDCLYIFNSRIRGTPVSFQEKLLPLVSEYLTEINYENSDKIIYLIIQNPNLIMYTFSTIEDYFCKKYNIFKLLISPKDLNFNFSKTLLYYV